MSELTFITNPQCEELNPEEVGQFLVEMYKDFEEFYSLEENSDLNKQSGNEDTSFDYDFYGDGEYEKPID